MRPKRGETTSTPFFECNRGDLKRPDKLSKQVSVMGYTFRYSDFRYTVWFYWDRVKNIPQLDVPTFAEELYDHRGETLANFTHLEYHNLVHQPYYEAVAKKIKAKALHFLRHDVVFRGPYE